MERFERRSRVAGLLGVALLVSLVSVRCGSGGGPPAGGQGGGVFGVGGGHAGTSGQAGAGAGGSGQAGAGAGGSSGTGVGGAQVGACTACRSDQVCVNGACVDVPGQCPCPVESYCDLASSKCVIGCTTNDQCSTGRACNVAARACVNGCRDDASCGAGRICDSFTCRAGCRQNGDCGQGSICVGTLCQTGCATTASCTATGQTCVSSTCQCPSAQMVCNNACTRVDTVQNCGTCGNACGKNNVCTGGQCVCPNGTCQPETVYTAAGSIRGLWVDGGYVYTLESASSSSNAFQRVAVAGGTAQMVAAVPAGESPSDAHVANGQVVFSTYSSDDFGTPLVDFYSVPGAGGTPRQLEEIAYPLGTPLIGTDGTVAYWFDYDQYDETKATLYKATLATGGYTNVATYYDNYIFSILVQGSTVYMPANGSNSTVGPTNLYDIHTYTGSTTLGSLLENDAATLGAIMVDSTGFYSSDISDAAKTESLVHTPLNGKSPVTLAAEGGRSLATDDTRLYYRSTDSKAIRRVLKAGGTPETFVSDPSGQLSYLAVSTGYTYFVQGKAVKRLATTFQP